MTKKDYTLVRTTNSNTTQRPSVHGLSCCPDAPGELSEVCHSVIVSYSYSLDQECDAISTSKVYTQQLSNDEDHCCRSRQLSSPSNTKKQHPRVYL